MAPYFQGSLVPVVTERDEESRDDWFTMNAVPAVSQEAWTSPGWSFGRDRCSTTVAWRIRSGTFDPRGARLVRL